MIEIQTMKPFIVPEMSFKRHSRSSAMAQFNRLRIISVNGLCLSYIISEIFNVE